MKKYFLAGLLLVLALGVGCAKRADENPIVTDDSGTLVKPEEAVEGVWYLEFDLPRGWVMVPQYDEDTQRAPTGVPVTTDLSDVVIQSTDQPIALSGESELPEGEYVTEGYTYIRVLRMDKSAIVPEEAEDLGNGFYRLAKGVDVTYYYPGEYAFYKFIVYQNGQTQAEAEAVITSAEEVTEFGGE